jgi:protein-tyrosine kinase
MSRIYDTLKKAGQEGQATPLPGVSHRAVRPKPGWSDAAYAPESRPPENTSLQGDLDSFLETADRAAWQPDRKHMLSFERRKFVIGLEEFRTLRSHLDQIRRQRPLKKLLVTSALPREGKTFIAANLAQVFARQAGRRVLLIDGDLRQSQMHVAFGAPAKPGLSDYLRGEAVETSVIQRSPLNGLFFIAGGKSADNPAELIANGCLKRLLDCVSPAFEWIIVDSPPVIPVSDAKLMADVCDGVLMVVQAGSTASDLAKKACQAFAEKRPLGVVLNRVKHVSRYSTYSDNSGGGKSESREKAVSAQP